MKKVFTHLVVAVLFSVLAINANAQHMSAASGPSQCTVVALSGPGLFPKPSTTADSLPCVVQNQCFDYTIKFKNYDTTTTSLGKIRINWLKIVSIANIPSGLCWASNQPADSFQNQENGCIHVHGQTNDAVGVYKLSIHVNVSVTLLSTGTTLPLSNIDAEQYTGLKYYVTVATSPCPIPHATDTTSANLKTAGTTPCSSCVLAINEITSEINNLEVQPNPFSNSATVKFYSENNGIYTARICDILGREVYSNQVNVKVGENNTTIGKNNLTGGVYFFSLSNGKSTTTKRIIVE